MINPISQIALEIGVNKAQIEATMKLLDEGGTVPFISRYRKEVTGSLDDVQISMIRDRATQLREIDKRRQTIIKSIEAQEKMTPQLRVLIDEADTMGRLEDIYLPYKPKRKTRASIAREMGLESLAQKILKQTGTGVLNMASEYISEDKGVLTNEDALQGARDIIAETINEDPTVRLKVRKLFINRSTIKSKVLKGKEEQGKKFKDYFDWEEKLKSSPSHRVLAMRRGEKEMVLSLDIHPDEGAVLRILEDQYLTSRNEASEQVGLAIKDCYKRLLKPSMETEARLSSKVKADEEAIRVFAENLHQLLLSAPLGQHAVMAIDPGFRTGCKLVCLDKQGKLLHYENIFPNQPRNKKAEAEEMIRQLCDKHHIEAIAVGNGTAGRETESFVEGIGLDKSIIVAMVNESGASIYSASEVARHEFPDHDVTVRGAVSIGRRLMDPLAELVKLDPKSIGVGQYQHDVDQNLLKKGLEDVVGGCVNSVGVEVNTASAELLAHVAGLGPQLGRAVVDYRNENGPYKSRKDLLKVPRLGAKAYEQAAGFLRIRKGTNPLDASAVHPESYYLVEKMAREMNCGLSELLANKKVRNRINPQQYVSETVGLPTLKDILDELEKPGRDPRQKFEGFSFDKTVNEISDLKVGMILPGIITNITNFGAFVDVGVHQDGLVHVSQMADKFVNNPAEVVAVQQKVSVTVTEVDASRKRISLSMKNDPFGKSQEKREKKESKRNDGGDMKSKLSDLRGKFGS